MPPSPAMPDVLAPTHIPVEARWLRRLGVPAGDTSPRPVLACFWAQHSGWVMAAVLLMLASRPGGGWMLTQALGLAVMAQVLSKQLALRLRRPRPFALGLAANHLGHGARGGLPSTHASVMASLTMFVGLLPDTDGACWLLACIAVSTGWARVRTGAHFPSDVLAGFALGALLGALVASA